MKVEYEILPEDITFYSKEAAPRFRAFHVQVIVMILAGLFFIFSDVIFAMLSVTSAGDSSTFLRSVLPRTLLFYAFLGVVYVAGIQMSKFLARKSARSAGKNGVFCGHTITLATDGFTEETEVNRNFHAWEGVDKLIETKSYITIQVRLGAPYFIPRRAFASDQDMDAFIDAVWSYLPEESRPQPRSVATDY